MEGRQSTACEACDGSGLGLPCLRVDDPAQSMCETCRGRGTVQKPATDLADLIVRVWDAWQDRHSELHDDPRIGPIVARAKEKYQEERRRGFERASLIARRQAIREIICQEADNA